MTSASRSATLPRSAQVAAVLLFAAAPGFALTTWQAPRTPRLAFAFAVIVIEALVAMLAFRAGLVRRGKPAFRSPAWLAAAIWLAAAAIATVFVAPYRYTALYLFDITLLHVVFLVLVTRALEGGWRGAERRLMLAAALGAAAYAAIMPLLVWLTPMDGAFVWAKIAAGTTHQRQLGFYGLTAVALASGLLATAPDRKADRWLAATISLGFYMTFWSGGRAATGGALVATALVAACCDRADRPRLLRTLLAAAASGAALSMVYLPTQDMGLLRLFRAAVPGDYDFSSGHLLFWRETLAAVAKDPWIGHGEGQWERLVKSGAGFNHPHNAVLQYLFQWGVIGTLAAAAACAPALVAASRNLAANRPAALPAFACLAGHLAMAQLEGNLFHIYPVSVIALCGAVLAANAGPRSTPSADWVAS